MKRNWRAMLVTAIVAGAIGGGCAVIIASDDHDDYDDEDCGRCHQEIVIVLPKDGVADSTAAVSQ